MVLGTAINYCTACTLQAKPIFLTIGQICTCSLHAVQLFIVLPSRYVVGMQDRRRTCTQIEMENQQDVRMCCGTPAAYICRDVS